MAVRVTRLYIEGFKRFARFEMELNTDFNIIVGDNETGKSTLLEAVGLVLTGQYGGRLIQYALDPYLFNAEQVATFFAARRNGQNALPPAILIEAYLHDPNGDPRIAMLSGTNNVRNDDCPGLKMCISVDRDQVEEMKEYAADPANPMVIPTEFYKAEWLSFSGNRTTLRTLPLRCAAIDASRGHVYRGPHRYLSQVANDVLSEADRRNLSLEYKKLQHTFAQQSGVKAINDYLTTQGNPATATKLTVQMDMSSRTSWGSAITAHLDNLPFDSAGRGEQCRIQIRLEIAKADRSHVLLIEEMENHLSHSNLNNLMEELRADRVGRQFVITTHSGFVLNKLGLDYLRLISHEGRSISLDNLSPGTRNYFMKLPGYDTLRLILSKRCILVEGPSDELIVQRAYRDQHGRLPLEDGVDVIAVGSLAFKRFLEIAVLLQLDVCVVTDNDGRVAALKSKYDEFVSAPGTKVRVCYDPDEDCPTLEWQLLRANSLATLNLILGKKARDADALIKYMSNNKTECALKMFEAQTTWVLPRYILDAVK